MGDFFTAFFDVLPKLIPGAGTTLFLTVCGVFFGIIIGLLMALMKMGRNRVLKAIANVYIEALRGTPLYVQIFLWHFGVASIIAELFFNGKFSFPLLVTGIVVLSLNSGAYVAEIFRAGIQGVDKGQVEAARSLGMTHKQAMRLVILPQAFKLVIPPLLAAIGLSEIMKRGQIYTSVHFEPFPTYVAVALVYLVLTLTFTRIINWYERRLQTDKR